MAENNVRPPPEMMEAQREKTRMLELCFALVQKWEKVRVVVKKLPVTKDDLAQMNETLFWREIYEDDEDNETDDSNMDAHNDD